MNLQSAAIQSALKTNQHPEMHKAENSAATAVGATFIGSVCESLAGQLGVLAVNRRHQTAQAEMDDNRNEILEMAPDENFDEAELALNFIKKIEKTLQQLGSHS